MRLIMSGCLFPLEQAFMRIFVKKSMDFRITFIDNDRSYTVFHRPGKIESFILHRCDKHGWELLETEEVSENQIKASFNSPGGPVAVVYRELPEEETELETETVAP